MHGPAHPTTFARLLALDLGKFTSVLCVYDPLAPDAHRFVTGVRTTPQSLHDLLAAHATDDPAATLLVIETCDVAGWVFDLATALGLTVLVANPAHEAWRWTRVKRKTDKDDALKLARLAALGQLPLAHMPPPAQRQRRRLVHYRRVLVDRRTRVKNQVRSIFSQQGLSLPPRSKAWTKAGIAQLAREARPLRECDDVLDLWRGRLHLELQQLESLTAQVNEVDAQLDALGAADEKVRLLRTVPGVGPRLAETVVAHLDDPKRFRTAAQVAPATPGWSRSSSRAARSSGAAASPAAARRCCGRCWWRWRGWCTCGTAGPKSSSSASAAGSRRGRTSRSSPSPENCSSCCGRCCGRTSRGARRDSPPPPARPQWR